jgi:energy-coupling factor transport system permease protein
MRFEFVPADSIVHRLDPRLKLLWFLAINLVITTWLDPIWVLCLYLSVIALAAAAKIPPREMLRGLTPAIPIVIALFVLNLLLHRAPGEPVLLGYLIPALGTGGPSIPIYLDTLVFSVGLSLRFLVILSSVMLLMKIQSPTEMAWALVKLGLPAEVGMAISISIAYVPVLILQITEVMEAQESRGARAGSRGNILRRIRSFLPVSIPTFFRAYGAAEEMAAAMLARGFGFDMRIRTEMRPRVLRPADKMLGISLLLFTVVGFALGLSGYADYHFTLDLLLHRGAGSVK